jgi:hypothetical protein
MSPRAPTRRQLYPSAFEKTVVAGQAANTDTVAAPGPSLFALNRLLVRREKRFDKRETP